MAVNPSNNKEKSNGSYKDVPKVILNAVPKNCAKIPFSEIIPGEDYENKAVIGKINHLYPITQRSKGHMRKILITDAHSGSEKNKVLSVYLLDKFAKESEAAVEEGYVIMTNFTVEKITRQKANDMPVQILMKKEESKIWFGRRKKPETSISPQMIRKSPRKPPNASEEAESKDLQNIRKSPRKIPNTSKGAESKDPPNIRKSPRRRPNPSNEAESRIPPKKRKSTRTKQNISDEEESHAVSHHYEYSKLGDLVEGGEKAVYNVFGIIDKCDLRITSGKKVQILNLFLTDQTETGFPCVVFAEPGELYPDVYPGDIIRIHRMQVYKFRGKLRGKCLNPKFILVFSKDSEGDTPRTVAKTFTFTPEDIARFKELLEWNKAKNCPKLLCEIQRDDYANFVCQVIGVYIARNTDTVVLKVWDGTKAKDFPGTHWGMKEEKLDQRLFTVARDYYVVLFVYGHHAAVAAELQPGQYIEVCDAHLYSPKDTPDDLKLCLHTGNEEGRGITLLRDNDSSLTNLKERLEKVINDTLAIGSQTDDLLSQNNSLFLNCDISMYTSSQRSNNNEAAAANEAVQPEEEPTSHNDEDISVLNDPLPKSDAPSPNEVVSVVDVSIKPGQSTQEFGWIPRDENIPDGENKLSTTSEPDPVCNLTPLQTRYFFHDPLQLPSQISSSIFPTYSKDSEEEWWNSVPTVSVTDGHTDIKPTSLSEIIQHCVPYKFRVLAAAVAFKPDTSSINDFVHLCCPKCFYISEDAYPLLEPFDRRDGLSYYFCPECSDKEGQEQRPVLEYNFVISFSLHDSTSPPIQAYLWKENAVKFFKGVTPEEALRDSATADSILHMLWSICPNCRPFNSTTLEASSLHPILDCCILSYTAANQTCYQIFDTMLI